MGCKVSSISNPTTLETYTYNGAAVVSLNPRILPSVADMVIVSNQSKHDIKQAHELWEAARKDAIASKEYQEFKQPRKVSEDLSNQNLKPGSLKLNFHGTKSFKYLPKPISRELRSNLAKDYLNQNAIDNSECRSQRNYLPQISPHFNSNPRNSISHKSIDGQPQQNENKDLKTENHSVAISVKGSAKQMKPSRHGRATSYVSSVRLDHLRSRMAPGRLTKIIPFSLGHKEEKDTSRCSPLNRDLFMAQPERCLSVNVKRCSEPMTPSINNGQLSAGYKGKITEASRSLKELPALPVRSLDLKRMALVKSHGRIKEFQTEGSVLDSHGDEQFDGLQTQTNRGDWSCNDLPGDHHFKVITFYIRMEFILLAYISQKSHPRISLVGKASWEIVEREGQLEQKPILEQKKVIPKFL